MNRSAVPRRGPGGRRGRSPDQQRCDGGRHEHGYRKAHEERDQGAAHRLAPVQQQADRDPGGRPELRPDDHRADDCDGRVRRSMPIAASRHGRRHEREERPGQRRVLTGARDDLLPGDGVGAPLQERLVRLARRRRRSPCRRRTRLVAPDRCQPQARPTRSRSGTQFRCADSPRAPGHDGCRAAPGTTAMLAAPSAGVQRRPAPGRRVRSGRSSRTMQQCASRQRPSHAGRARSASPSPSSARRTRAGLGPARSATSLGTASTAQPAASADGDAQRRVLDGDAPALDGTPSRRGGAPGTDRGPAWDGRTSSPQTVAAKQSRPKRVQGDLGEPPVRRGNQRCRDAGVARDGRQQLARPGFHTRSVPEQLRGALGQVRRRWTPDRRRCRDRRAGSRSSGPGSSRPSVPRGSAGQRPAEPLRQVVQRDVPHLLRVQQRAVHVEEDGPQAHVLKYFASGWCTTIASVDCSGCSWNSSDSSTPIRSGRSSCTIFARSSRFGQAP